ncbi:MAG: hypothetical protein AB7W28_01815 [Armatimonadota bacterium]
MTRGQLQQVLQDELIEIALRQQEIVERLEAQALARQASHPCLTGV